MTLEMVPEAENNIDIDSLRGEIDRLDAEILAAVKRRTEVSQAIGRAGWPPAARDWCTAVR